MKNILLSLLLFTSCVQAQQLPPNIPNFDNFLIVHAWAKHTSGVIYFAYDFKNNPQKMCDDIAQEPWRMTMIDEEGAPVIRIKGAAEPPSYEESKHLSLSSFQTKVMNSARELQKYCLKVNLAPVVDTQIGSRNYSQNPNITHQYASAFSNAMKTIGIVSAWKHFPGLNKVQTVYDNENYKRWYKNINGEGVIDLDSSDSINENIVSFRSNDFNIIMFSLAIYPSLDDKPAIFNDNLLHKAHIEQPNSLLIPDDLSEINLTGDNVIWLFKHFDLLLFTSPQDAINVKKILVQAYLDNKITLSDIEQKTLKQNQWRKHNHLNLLPPS